MTQQSTVFGDPSYRPVLDHGFVGIVDAMGNDAAIVQAARVSYGEGNKKINTDRALIRYLLRNHHSTPFEMCDIKYHVRAPIFVFRQWHRHRSANINEESARYSEMTDEFYLPEPEHIQPQSADNKQGRAGDISDASRTGVRWLMNSAYRHSHDVYNAILKEAAEAPGVMIYDPYGGNDPLLDSEFPGVARELARAVMPVGSYSEMYWKVNLRNLFHFLNLRVDPHAQYEIRAYAEEIIDLTRPLFPFAFEAFDDYNRFGAHLSRMETSLLHELLMRPEPGETGAGTLRKWIAVAGSAKDFAEAHGMTLREFKEFLARFKLSDAIA